MEAFHKGLLLINHSEFMELKANMDSTTIKHYLKAPNPPWDVRNTVRKAKACMEELHSVRVTHCYREVNALADALANLDANDSRIEMEKVEVGQLVNEIICNDANG